MNTPTTSLYDDLKAAQCEISNWQSDLYVPTEPIAFSIIEAHNQKCSRFTGCSDGLSWLEVNFAFDPYWEAREPTKVDAILDQDDDARPPKN